MSTFDEMIRPHVDAELRAATSEDLRGSPDGAFRHLERAHVLGQVSTVEHVRVHWHMFRWGLRHRNFRECMGQAFRIVGAATMTGIGLVPHGNTGGANVSPFKPMPLPSDLEACIQQARGSAK